MNREPLPPGWKSRKARTGRMMYYHAATNTRTFERPTSSTVTLPAHSPPGNIFNTFLTIMLRYKVGLKVSD